MTIGELEKEVLKLRVQLRVLVSCLTKNTALPILGPTKNWEDYESVLRQEMAKEGLHE